MYLIEEEGQASCRCVGFLGGCLQSSTHSGQKTRVLHEILRRRLQSFMDIDDGP
jgi:hypothetical protein